jgi:hypothetical protein
MKIGIAGVISERWYASRASEVGHSAVLQNSLVKDENMDEFL